MATPFSNTNRRVNDEYYADFVDDEAISVVTELAAAGYSGKVAYLEYRPLRTTDSPGIAANPRVWDAVPAELTEVFTEPAAANQFRVDYRDGRIQFHTSIADSTPYTVDYYAAERILHAADFTNSSAGAGDAGKVVCLDASGEVVDDMIPEDLSSHDLHVNTLESDGNVSSDGDFIAATKTLKRVLGPSAWGLGATWYLAPRAGDISQSMIISSDGSGVAVLPIVLPPDAVLKTVTIYGECAGSAGAIRLVRNESIGTGGGSHVVVALGDGAPQDDQFAAADSWTSKTLTVSWQINDAYEYHLEADADHTFTVGAVILGYEQGKPLL